jgi:hypothetical protein
LVKGRERKISLASSLNNGREKRTVRQGVDLHVALLVDTLQAGEGVDTCFAKKAEKGQSGILVCSANAVVAQTATKGQTGSIKKKVKGRRTVDVHCATSANTLPARPPERKSRVELVLNLEDGVENHGSALVEVDRVGLEVRLLSRLVGVLRKKK